MSPRRLLLPLLALLALAPAEVLAAKDTKSTSKPGPADDGDEDEEDPEWDAPSESKGHLSDEPGDEDPDEDEIAPAPKPKAPPPAAAEKPAAPAEKPLATQGKAALGDHFPLKVVAKDLDAVTIELPIIVAAKAADYPGKDWWLSAEIFADGAKVGEARYLITKDGLAELSPTVVWVRSVVGLKKPAGVIELRLAQIVDPAAPKPLFTRQTAYAL